MKSGVRDRFKRRARLAVFRCGDIVISFALKGKMVAGADHRQELAGGRVDRGKRGRCGSAVFFSVFFSLARRLFRVVLSFVIKRRIYF